MFNNQGSVYRDDSSGDMYVVTDSRRESYLEEKKHWVRRRQWPLLTLSLVTVFLLCAYAFRFAPWLFVNSSGLGSFFILASAILGAPLAAMAAVKKLAIDLPQRSLEQIENRLTEGAPGICEDEVYRRLSSSERDTMISAAQDDEGRHDLSAVHQYELALMQQWEDDEVQRKLERQKYEEETKEESRQKVARLIAASPSKTTLLYSRVPYRFRYDNLEVGKEYRVDVTADNFMTLKDGEDPNGILFTFTPTSTAGCFDTVRTIEQGGAITDFSYSVPDDCNVKE